MGDSSLLTASETGEICWHQTSYFSQLYQEPTKVNKMKWNLPCHHNQTDLRVIKHWILHDRNVPILLGSVSNDGPALPLWSPHLFFLQLLSVRLVYCTTETQHELLARFLKWKNEMLKHQFDRFKPGARADKTWINLKSGLVWIQDKMSSFNSLAVSPPHFPSTFS